VRRGTIKETEFPPDKGCSVAGMWMKHLSCVSTSQSFRVLWCSTVLKQKNLLMFEGSFCHIFSGHW